MAERLGEALVVGDAKRPFQPDPVAPASLRHLVAPADPDRGAEGRTALRPLDAPDLSDGGPPSVDSLGSVLSVPVRTTRSGGEGREESPVQTPIVERAPAHPEGEHAHERIAAATIGVTDDTTLRPPTASTTS